MGGTVSEFKNGDHFNWKKMKNKSISWVALISEFQMG